MFKFVSVIVALVVCGTLAVSGTKEDIKTLDPKIEAILQKCKTSSGVTLEHLKNMISGEIPLQGNTGCFLACIAKELDMMKANNMLDKDKVYRFMDILVVTFKEEKKDAFFNEGKKIVDSCLAAQQGGDDACIAAKNFGECVFSGMKKAGLLP